MTLATIIVLMLSGAAENALYEAETIFPPEPFHNHSSSITETPQGDLLACWFHGRGERTDDSLVITGARKRKDAAAWSAPFLMADNKDLPDQNPVLFVDPRGTLWLFWVSSLDNSVRSYLLKYRTSTKYAADGPPKWNWQDVILCRPRDIESMAEITKTTSDRLFQRLGWMTRQPPIMLSDTRMMLGLYSDVFDCSLMAFTDDWGETWQFSKPMILTPSRTIQPSLVKKANGNIVAFMRAALHIRRAESSDGGMTWTEAPMASSGSMDIPNPGSSVACIRLNNSHWVLVCNDTLIGRNILSVYLSDDEGQTWKWKRRLESLPDEATASYPTVIQAVNSTIHATYSYKDRSRFEGSTIKHVRFSEPWIQAGDH
jgi:predicted neuraminidase